MSKKECGVCGSDKDLIGPYAGGPFTFYCKNCRDIIDKYNAGVKAHKEWIMKQLEKRTA